MLVITGYVMKLAPVAVFAAMAATVAVNGSRSSSSSRCSWAISTSG
jgi:Na+/H+-dicarboxylate symporter